MKISCVSTAETIKTEFDVSSEGPSSKEWFQESIFRVLLARLRTTLAIVALTICVMENNKNKDLTY